MHREFGIINSYTLEVSFCGPTQGAHKDTHFTQKLLRVSSLHLTKLSVCEGNGVELLQGTS